MDYVPLTAIWPRNGLLSVIVSSLEDAGFSPVIECDPRGWMHFYSWPMGSSGPVTVWIPGGERDEAAAFLASPIEESWGAEEVCADSLWWLAFRYRRGFFVFWLLFIVTGLVGM